MAKFNLNSLLSGTSLNNMTEEKPKKQNYKVIPISVYDLVPSKDNFYSMGQIEELKTAIELVGGVKQNLSVIPLEDGKYKVLAGHRRRLASIALVEEGKKEYEFVPCGIEIKETDADLQEIREELLLILTNSQRDKTDWDKVEEVKRLRSVLERYKKKEKIPGRLRKIIAEVLNTSPTQVERMERIDKNLSEEFKEEFKEQKINISTAYELSKLSKDTQRKALKEYEEKGALEIKDVKAIKSNPVEVVAEQITATIKQDKLYIEIPIRTVADKYLSLHPETITGGFIPFLFGEVAENINKIDKNEIIKIMKGRLKE